MSRLYQTDSMAHSLHTHLVAIQNAGQTDIDVYPGVMPSTFDSPIQYQKLVTFSGAGVAANPSSGLRYYSLTTNPSAVAIMSGLATWCHLKIGSWGFYIPVNDYYIKLSNYNIILGESYTLTGFRVRLF